MPTTRIAIAAGLALLVVGCTGRTDPAPRNLVVISLDTARRDHFGIYGYPRETTPRLARFADDAVVFDSAFAQEANTAPSHASMFTGLYPHHHGCRRNGGTIDPDVVTLAERLSAAGFRSAAFVSGFPMDGETTGLDRGFELYDDEYDGHRRDGIATGRNALRWVGSLEPDERYFLFVHLYDSHGPYVPPAKYAGRFRPTDPGPQVRVPKYQRISAGGQTLTRLNPYVALYDALLRYQDDIVVELLERLDLDETIVVILADHGETLGDRSYALDHGAQLFDEQIRIPLIVRVPGLPPRRVGVTVETVDLLPTLLELLRVDGSATRDGDGFSLVDALSGDERPLRTSTVASARAENDRVAARGYQFDERKQIYSVRSSRWKLIRYPGLSDPIFELYDLDADPGESADLAVGHPDVVESLRVEIERWLDGADEVVDEPELSPEMREQLESLGYVGGS